MKKFLQITMQDGSKWGVPVDIIARNRAEYYADREFNGDAERRLAEDVMPLFKEDEFLIQSWAAGCMNWSDVEAHAVKLEDATPPDFQEAWVNGDKEIVLVREPKSKVSDDPLGR